MTLFAEQLLNGLSFGLLLFLVAAGLTLIFGIMEFINLAHGSLYMIGAYLTATVVGKTDSFLLALVVAIVGTALMALLLEVILIRRLYRRNHLTQVLATFALALIANEVVRLIWGAQPLPLDMPAALAGAVEIVPGFFYPAYRLFIIAISLLVALALYFFINHTRTGMWLRAGASNRDMALLMGIPINPLFTGLFALGGGLCALAGGLIGPLTAVQPGMGENILILSFVVVVIGGMGSVRGALAGALLIGMIDTLGRAFLPALCREFFPLDVASTLGPALASIAIYVMMGAVLFCKPAGLFPVKS